MHLSPVVVRRWLPRFPGRARPLTVSCEPRLPQISQNKRRYQENGFDLDLTYVTDRIIAMSFPSQGKTALYRNPIGEVVNFFNSMHPEHYRLYNLCGTSALMSRLPRVESLPGTP